MKVSFPWFLDLWYGWNLLLPLEWRDLCGCSKSGTLSTGLSTQRTLGPASSGIAADVSDMVLLLHTSGVGIEVMTGLNTCFVVASLRLDSRAPNLSLMELNCFDTSIARTEMASDSPLSWAFSAMLSGTDRQPGFSPRPRRNSMGSADVELLVATVDGVDLEFGDFEG